MNVPPKENNAHAWVMTHGFDRGRAFRKVPPSHAMSAIILTQCALTFESEGDEHGRLR